MPSSPRKTKQIHLFCAVAVVSSGILFGGMISKNLADFLEDTEYFVRPDDNDDD